jgi:uncharacterized DUF497 family protein
MHFEWDVAKNLINIRKHGIDFVDVVDMFNHPMLTLSDDSQRYAEERWIAMGWIQTTIGVVVYTEKCGDTIRIISARKATKHEVKRYEQRL